MPKKRIIAYLHALYQSAVNTIDHDGIEHAGYLAFLSMLSFFPFLVVLVALAGVIGQNQAGQEFVSILLSHLPEHVADALKPRISEIVSGPPQGLITISIIGAIWTASSAVEGLRTILNRAYRVGTPPSYAWRRFMSVVQLVIATVIVLTVMLGLIFMPIVMQHLGKYSLEPIQIAFSVKAMSYALTFAVLLLVVSLIYYVLPNIRQSFFAALPGAIIVVFLWFGAAIVFSFYLGQFNQVNLIYGSLGGIIATLLFFYIMSVIFIYGAEFNYLLERLHGKRLEQKEAVPPEGGKKHTR